MTVRLVVRGVRVPGPAGNRLGWAVGEAIEWFEGTRYAHVFPALQFPDGPAVCWNIAGWLDSWRRVPAAPILNLYGSPEVIWTVDLEDDVGRELQRWWDSYSGRRYAVGRLLCLPLWRLTGWGWVRRLAGITCTAVMASGLQRIGLWKHPCPIEMAGLKEVQAVLDAVGVRIRG